VESKIVPIVPAAVPTQRWLHPRLWWEKYSVPPDSVHTMEATVQLESSLDWSVGRVSTSAVGVKMLTSSHCDESKSSKRCSCNATTGEDAM